MAITVCVLYIHERLDLLQSAAPMCCQNAAPLGLYVENPIHPAGSAAIIIHMLQVP